MTNLQAALTYAAKGWHVFPVGRFVPPDHPNYKDSKRPLTPNGKDDATTDGATIRAWWAEWPDARIAVAGGPSSLLPVDWDPYKAGRAGLDEIAQAAGAEWPDTLTASTPSGGVHRYYRLPPGDWTDRRETHTSAVCTKINGYVILPSERAGYVWTNVVEPAELPEALVVALLKPEPAAGPGPSDDAEVAERQQRLVDHVAGLGLGEYRWKNGIGVDERGRVILELEDCPFDPAGHSAPWKAYLGVGSNGGTFAGCVVDGCADKSWRDLQPGPPTKVPLTNKRPLRVEEWRYVEDWLDERVSSIDDMLALPPIEWLVPGLLQMGATAQIVGPSTGGKSLWTLQTCLDLTLDGKTVLYCALEGKNGFNGRLRAQLQERGVKQLGRLFFYDLRVLLQHEETVAELRDTVRTLGADVIVLDTLVRAAPGVKENDAGEMQALIEQAESLKHRRDVSVWMLHHSGHDQSRGRGSSAVPAAVDNTVFIFPVGSNDGKEGRDLVVKVYSDKVKDGRPTDGVVYKRHEHLLGHLKDGTPWTSVVFRPVPADQYLKTSTLEAKVRDLIEAGVPWKTARNKFDGSQRPEARDTWQRLVAEGVRPIDLD